MTAIQDRSRLVGELRQLHAEFESARTAYRVREAELVVAARQVGATWTDCGEALGCTPQAVQARYPDRRGRGGWG